MRNTLNSLLITALALGTLNLSAVADPASEPKGQTDPPSVTTISEILEVRKQPESSVIVQEDVEKELRVEQPQERPRGRSRVDQPKPGSLEKPLLEIHGF